MRPRVTVAAVTLGGMAVLFAFRGFFLAPEGWSALAPDEAQRAWHALQVTQGRLIYRDFWVQYTPLSFYWHALAFRVCGPGLWAIRLALVCTGTVILACCASVAYRLAGRLGAILAGALSLSFGIPSYNSGYPAWEAMAFSAGALWVVTRSGSSSSACLAGVLAGLSTMTKINVGGLTLLALMSVLAMGCSRAVRLATGVATLAAVCWLAVPAQPLEGLIQFVVPVAVLLAVSLSGPAGEGSVAAMAGALGSWAATCLAILAPFGAKMGVGPLFRAVVLEPLRFAPLIRYESPMLRFHPLHYALAACWLVAGLAALRPERVPRRVSVAAFLVTALGLFPGALAVPSVPVAFRFLMLPVMAMLVWSCGRRSSLLLAAGLWAALLHVQVHPSHGNMHLAWALSVAWPLLVGLSRFSAARVGSAAWGIPLALAMAQAALCAKVFVHTDWEWLPRPRGGIAVPAQDRRELASVLDEVRVLRPSSLLDLTSGCLVAFLADLPCPLRHGYLWRGFLTPEEEEREVAALSRAPPPVGVRRSAGRGQFRWDAICRYAPTLCAWVDRTYLPHARVGRFEVMVVRSDASGRPIPQPEPGPEGG